MTASKWKVKVDDGAKSGDELIAWQYLAEIIVDLAACEKERDEWKIVANGTEMSRRKAEARVKELQAVLDDLGVPFKSGKEEKK